MNSMIYDNIYSISVSRYDFKNPLYPLQGVM